MPESLSFAFSLITWFGLALAFVEHKRLVSKPAVKLTLLTVYGVSVAGLSVYAWLTPINGVTLLNVLWNVLPKL